MDETVDEVLGEEAGRVAAARAGTRRETFVFAPEQGVPPQVGPSAHATRWGDLVFCTGQLPTDPITGELVPGGVLEQAEQVRRNVAAVLGALGLTWDDALVVRVHLADLATCEAFDEAYRAWFRGPLPARSCVGVSALALGAALEVEVVAAARR
ncbi:RidA family protein [Kineococcus glutinatus]|uniref:RidA family protein n=1 Tax=Kineococcus glutinatus TaxID=1070872 RepID=UPI0031E9D2CE